jgi:hypothetical protein
MRGSSASARGNHPPSFSGNIGNNHDSDGSSSAVGGGRGGGGSRGSLNGSRNSSGRKSIGNAIGGASSSWDSRRGGSGRVGTANGNQISPALTARRDAAPPDTEPALRVLSFYEHGQRIAFACYVEDDNEIIFEDVRAHTGADTERIVRGVMLETRPNLILLSNKVVANVPLLECLTKRYHQGDGDDACERRRGPEQNHDDNTAPRDASMTGSVQYQLLKTSAFEPRQCRSVILSQLRVLTLMRNCHPTTADHHRDDFDHAETYTTMQRPVNNFHSLSSIINFDSPTLIRALGSLLIHLRNTAFRLEEGFTVTVNNLRRCAAPDSFLRLDESTLRTLRIFAIDRQPLVVANCRGGQNDRNRSKEGFSLFALLDRTRSKAGRERLRRWMAQPLRDVDAICQRHIGIELFIHPESRPAASLVVEQLSAVGSMDSILLRMQRCCAAQPNDFLALIRMLDASHAIIATLGGELRDKAYMLDRHISSVSEQHEQLQQQYPSVAYIDDLLRRCHVPVIRNLRERMAFLIDEEATAEVKDHVVIHFGVNEELDRAKETFETLDGEFHLLSGVIDFGRIL